MNIHHIEENIKKLSESINEETFIYDFLLSYGIPKTSVTRLKKGDFNASKEKNEVLWKKKIFFKIERDSNLLTSIDNLKRENRILKHKPMFIMVTDFKNLLVLDIKVGDTLDIPITKLAKHFEFFLPLIGMEKTKIQSENPADVKAAEKLGKLYDVLVEENHPKTEEEKHALNVFLSRLLFCFFAEDTNIFPEGIFTNSIASHTKSDGSDLKKYLEELFKILNLKNRKDVSGFLADFPYVNGGLFEKELNIPSFNSRSHKIIIECGSLNWAFINPDIFGSMIQSVANPETRSDMGMHYTSVANIMKVIEPLFLNDLKNELEKAEKNEVKLQEFMIKHPKHPRIRTLIKENEKKLKAFLQRIYNIRIFDPACGSGNFLIIAYKELCKLEIEIFKIWHGSQASQGLKSEVKTSQFYGIELDDFACETAKLSLWLAEHQMNLLFEEVFGETKPTLPLEDGGNIVCGNSTRLDWEKICPKHKDGEVYILGNPPYLGSSMQNTEQKKDLELNCGGFKNYKNLDYISSWFIKGKKYIEHYNSKMAFVSTNSIVQGEQVGLLWSNLLGDGVEIFFAHQEFLWNNNAKSNAKVTCVIVGLRNNSNGKKVLFQSSQKKEVKNINAYLVEGKSIYIFRRSKALSDIREMKYGNKATDDGNLILSDEEKTKLIKSCPEAEKYIKRLIGSNELIRGITRWCLWISDTEVEDASKCKEIKKRLDAVVSSRMKSKAKCTIAYAKYPNRFKQITHRQSTAIVIPRVSSERRSYIPFGFVDENTIVLDSAQAVYGAEIFDFGVLNSRMHNVWVKATSGRLESRIRYSSALSYNTFPFPKVSTNSIELIEEKSFAIIEVRESNSEMSLADLYDPDHMPDALRKAHEDLDQAIEHCYRKSTFRSDAERLEFLFKLYEEMIEKEEKKDK